MVQEEELPGSLEDLKKEIEELEESLEKVGKSIEVTPSEEVQEKPEVGYEKAGFSIKAVFVGHIVYVGLIISIGLLVGATGYIDILELVVVSFFLAVPALHVALNQQLPSGTGFFNIISNWIEKFDSVAFLDYMRPYGLFLLIGMLPAIIAGVIAGAISRDKAYGFAAGVFVWVLGFLVSVLLVLAVPSLNIKEDFLSLIMDMITNGYLSAVFLAIFGILGGGMRQS